MVASLTCCCEAEMKTAVPPPTVVRPPDVIRVLKLELPAQCCRYRKWFKRCQQEFSAPAVHHSRIATRRLLTTLELLGDLVPKQTIRKLRNVLKEHLDSFGPLRDTQVQLRYVRRFRRKHPAAQEFRVWLRERKVRFGRKARRALKQAKTRRVAKLIARIDEELEQRQKTLPPAKAFAKVQDALRVAFARADRLRQQACPAVPKTIHRARVAFKRFRYMVEALVPVGAPLASPRLQAMRRYQVLMGDIQDMEVLLRALDKFIKQADTNCQMQPLRTEFTRRRDQLIRRYVRNADKLERFRPASAIRQPHGKKRKA